MLKVLIIGSGGREHAIAWKLAQDSRIGRIYVAPGNGGTAELERVENLPPRVQRRCLCSPHLDARSKSLVCHCAVRCLYD